MKLHLGCGKRFIEGYIHIDAVDYPHIDHLAAIDNLSFIQDASVDVIYACHVLEHFKKNQVDSVLLEWKRVLKPGGVMRISVPDFSQLCLIYDKFKDLNLIMGPLFGRGDYLYNIHYTCFDYESLKSILVKVGFVNIEVYDWRKTEHCDVDDYSQAYIPHMNKEDGIQVSLNIECRRGY